MKSPAAEFPTADFPAENSSFQHKLQSLVVGLTYFDRRLSFGERQPLVASVPDFGARFSLLDESGIPQLSLGIPTVGLGVTGTRPWHTLLNPALAQLVVWGSCIVISKFSP